MPVRWSPGRLTGSARNSDGAYDCNTRIETEMLLAPLLIASALGAPASPGDTAGERMGFTINYLGMRMGTASISVRERADSLVPIELEAHTTGLARGVYDFREKLVSNIDPESGLPTSFVLDTNERGWKHHDTTDYDRAAGKAVVVQRGKTTSTDHVSIPPGTIDFVALVFLLRRMPLAPGDRHTFPVLSGDEVHEVVTEVMGRETVRTKAGTFVALKVRVPTGFTGAFSERNPTYLWLSDDSARIVVRLSTDFSFGGAVAELIEYTPGNAGLDGTAKVDGAAAKE